MRMKVMALAGLALASGFGVFIGAGGRGGGTATAAAAHAPGVQGPAAYAVPPPLGALPPGAGFPQAFAFDPRNPDIVYVATVSYPHGTTRGHVYKSTDGGRDWHATATRGTGWTGDVVSLAADPQHPGTLYAGTNVAVYKTIDGGRSWQPWNRGLFPPPGRKRPYGTPGTPSFNRGNGWVTDIAVDPANTNIVYSATDGVRKSTDGGHSWKTVLRPSGPYGHVSALAIAPTRPEAIYAIESDDNFLSSIYKSTDAGKTWRATWQATGGKFDWGSALVVDPQQPTTVYAATGHTLIRTTDGGGSWQPMTGDLPSGNNPALAVDTQHSGTVYAGLQTGRQTGGRYKTTYNTSGIYMTTNGGDTWNQPVSGLVVYPLAVDPARPTTIYAAGAVWATHTTFRILKSTDDGRTWAIAP